MLQLAGQQSLQASPSCGDVDTAYKDEIAGWTPLACPNGAWAPDDTVPWSTTCVNDLYDANIAFLPVAYFMTAFFLVWEVARGCIAQLKGKPILPYLSYPYELPGLVYDGISLIGHVVAVVFVGLAFGQVNDKKTEVTSSECFTHHKENREMYLAAVILYGFAILSQLLDAGLNMKKNDDDIKKTADRPTLWRAPMNGSSWVKALSALVGLGVAFKVSLSQLTPDERCTGSEEVIGYTNIITLFGIATVLFAYLGLEQVETFVVALSSGQENTDRANLTQPGTKRIRGIKAMTYLNTAYSLFVVVALTHSMVKLFTGSGLSGCQDKTTIVSKNYGHWVFWPTLSVFLFLFAMAWAKDKAPIKGRVLGQSNVLGGNADDVFARPRTSADMQTLRLTHDGPDKKASSLSFV